MSSSDSQPARVTVIGRSQRVGSGADRQRVVDPEHHCNYSQVPHLLLEDSAAGKLESEQRWGRSRGQLLPVK